MWLRLLHKLVFLAFRIPLITWFMGDVTADHPVHIKGDMKYFSCTY